MRECPRQMAANAKAEYTELLQAYESASGPAGKRKMDKENEAPRNAGVAKKMRECPRVMRECPRKPTGGEYLLYFHDTREDVMKSLPPGSHKMSDTTKIVSEMWRALPAEEQEPYKKMFIEE